MYLENTRRKRLWLIIHAGRLPDELHHPTGRNVPGGPVHFFRIEAKVDVIEIGVITFIQQADIFEYFAPDDHACASNPVRLDGLVHHRRGYDPTMEQSRNYAEPPISV